MYDTKSSFILLFYISIVTIIFSCSYPEIIRDELVYENDFENDDLSNIDGGVIENFNGSKVIGFFNNDGFTIHLDNVGSHDYVFVSLYYDIVILVYCYLIVSLYGCIVVLLHCHIIRLSYAHVCYFVRISAAYVIVLYYCILSLL